MGDGWSEIQEDLRTGVPLPLHPSLELAWTLETVDKRAWWLLIFPQLKAIAMEHGFSASAALTFGPDGSFCRWPSCAL